MLELQFKLKTIMTTENSIKAYIIYIFFLNKLHNKLCSYSNPKYVGVFITAVDF